MSVKENAAGFVTCHGHVTRFTDATHKRHGRSRKVLGMQPLRIASIVLWIACAACGGSRPPPAEHPATVEIDSGGEQTGQEGDVVIVADDAQAAPSAPAERDDDKRDPRNVVPALPIAPP